MDISSPGEKVSVVISHRKAAAVTIVVLAAASVPVAVLIDSGISPPDLGGPIVLDDEGVDAPVRADRPPRAADGDHRPAQRGAGEDDHQQEPSHRRSSNAATGLDDGAQHHTGRARAEDDRTDDDDDGADDEGGGDD